MKRTKASRNDRCPICGEKMKNCKGHISKKQKVLIMIAICMAIVSLAFAGYNHLRKRQAIIEQGKMKKVQEIAYTYLQGHGEDEWWLSDSGNKINAFQRAKAHTERLMESLKNYQHISPLSQEIAEKFPCFRTTIFDRDTSFSLEQNNCLELCFLSQNAARKQPSSFYYRSEWVALMMPGVKAPDHIISAIAYHELGHALRHIIEKAPSATSPPSSNLYISEEVEMHELESNILNTASEGKFYGYIDDFVRNSNAKNYKDLIFKISATELQSLDKITDGDECSVELADKLGVQYILTFGLRYIDLHYADKPQMQIKKKIELYRWLRYDVFGYSV